MKKIINRVAAIFYALVVLGLEYLIFFSDSLLFYKLLFHILIVNGCILYVFACKIFERDLRFPLLLAILTAGLGPFGPAIYLLTLLLYFVFSVTAWAQKDLFAALFPEVKADASEVVYERILQGLDVFYEAKTLPFVDVVMFGNEKQKRLAIEKMLRYYRPDFATALKQALQDSNNGIRVLAATAINTLDRHYFKTFLEFEKLYRKNSSELEHTLKFAAHCDLYLRSGVLEETRLKKIIDCAVEAYEKCLEIKPNQQVLQEHLARLYLQKGRADQSIALLENYINAEAPLSSGISKWIMASLFSTKDYAGIRAFAKKQKHVEESSADSLEVNGLLAVWGAFK